MNGYFFAERHTGLSFSRIVWHADGYEFTALDFINGYALAQSMASEFNLQGSHGQPR